MGNSLGHLLLRRARHLCDLVLGIRSSARQLLCYREFSCFVVCFYELFYPAVVWSNKSNPYAEICWVIFCSQADGSCYGNVFVYGDFSCRDSGSDVGTITARNWSANKHSNNQQRSYNNRNQSKKKPRPAVPFSEHPRAHQYFLC